ncbi:MAG TPA: ABC transporter ATP-binding protein [Dehalococcoidia bacterium]|jgi:putative ABC transport system ATP-binding protein|nr:ABC transporter ATP-binding protein [Dehalococcoidia bacterium]
MSTNTARTLDGINVPAGPTDSIIDVHGLVKTYSAGDLQVQALRGVDLTVRRGEMVAIMGPSGSGKTTLLNCISGLDAFDAGTVHIGGVDLASMNDKQKTAYRALNMGFIFQTYNLLPVLSAVENVELPLVVSGVNARQARELAMQALERVGLGDRAYNRPAQLSGGQRQRVTVARALVNDPAIVWADEPTGALDSKTANEIMTLMEQLNAEKGQTFVIVTHDAGVGRRCDRLVNMSDGLIVDEPEA